MLYEVITERIYKSGIDKIAAIHRGFYPFEDTKFRNIPKWELMIELKTTFPNLQIINDRITSYNVCYTKLLRIYCLVSVFIFFF